jgi:NAD(P)-dependent dehydrogenase (short-subunit alcohol dehydrogenase family)
VPDIEERLTMAQVKVDFSGTTVFVAGGTSGINFGIAEGFAAAGARLAVMSRSARRSTPP